MPEVQDVFRLYGAEYKAARRMSSQQAKAFDAVSACRTSELGGHRDVCPECGEVAISYNSCRNRHCPKCQAYRKERWVEERSADLLDIGYYHAVFTVPSELYPVFYCNQEACYGLLFRCAWETVDEFASDPRHLGAKTGATAVLHTWGRQLQYHPHVHMIIPSGGLTREGLWRQGSSKFFAPVKAMSKVFRGKLLSAIQRMRPALSFCGGAAHLADDGAFSSAISALYAKEWVVYCKKPFAGAGHVLRYLGRYTHRVAISNSRIVSIDGGKVRFKYRDNKDGDREKECSVDALEFIRRFLMHVLPKGFAKIRHYGILASRGKNERIDRCKRLTNTPVTARVAVDAGSIVERMIGRKPGTCAHCGCRTVSLPLLC
ncbi:MAG: IS91 family transposase [Succinivibrio sp.]